MPSATPLKTLCPRCDNRMERRRYNGMLACSGCHMLPSMCTCSARRQDRMCDECRSDGRVSCCHVGDA